MSVQEAIRKFELRQTRPKRHNKAPEKRVETQCVEWFRANEFSMYIYDSKGKYVQHVGYVKSRLTTGHSDSAGCDSFGMACYVEFKAKGKCRNLSAEQREFLLDKINRNAFGACVDSAELLERRYHQWLKLRKLGRPEDAKALLKGFL